MNLKKKDIFKNWEKNATMRNAPLSTLESLDKLRFFSPSVSPLLNIKLISELPEKEIRFVEIQLLYRYLEFTEYLETKLVNPELLKIATDSYRLNFPHRIQVNAYKIYCDEAFHALQAFNMIDQIHHITGVQSLNFEVDLKNRLEPLAASIHPSIQKYFYLFFVAVSECLVSQELNGYIKDKSIHSEIYALMRDHARDEVVHAAFFVDILEYLYNQLGAKEFQHFVDFIPKMLEAYLLPNTKEINRIIMGLKNPSLIEKLSSERIKKEYSETFLANSGSYLNGHVSRIIKGN